MDRQRGFTAVEFSVVIVILLGVGGWIANIVKMIGAVSDPITAFFIARAVGIFFAPLGAVLGYL